MSKVSRTGKPLAKLCETLTKYICSYVPHMLLGVHAECIYGTLVGTSPDKYSKWKQCNTCGQMFAEYMEEEHHMCCREIVRIGPVKSMYRNTKPQSCKVKNSGTGVTKVKYVYIINAGMQPENLPLSGHSSKWSQECSWCQADEYQMPKMQKHIVWTRTHDKGSLQLMQWGHRCY